MHLSTDISKTGVVSSLKMAYSSEGVPTPNVADKIEFLKLSAQCYSPTKSKKQRWFALTEDSKKQNKLILFGHNSESMLPAWLTRLAGSVLLSQSFD